jgi:hypothetical protein
MTARVASCFSKLWRLGGRGAVLNLALIEWIDQNAWLSYGNWMLRKWSKMKGSFAFSLSALFNVKSWKFLGLSQNWSQSSKNFRNAESTAHSRAADCIY